ncbi:anti-sigma factor [Paraglaciecola sp. MB-3u-78]|uniref:anti-sigma factor family protein n=1 Tax=Paraglaciecola sp. MB-3u-78 TaxID=2058332 RepID=UPI000C34EA79|nr:hypothetical protein [Paraglaciecola sp. MB-3u-78]PKG98699.1 hypothetical protein CXF95_12585 [Paraglaciecola sp. MB-3u-78]
MNISNDLLSGFLDAELPPEDMEQVRLALETDDDLVMRMAELSQVDQWVLEHAQQIDHTEVPQKLVVLAQQLDVKSNRNTTAAVNNVVQISPWKKWTADIKTPYAMAAGVALVASIAMLNLSQQTTELGFSNDIAAVLNTELSGETAYLADGSMVKAQLSFANQQGQLCRQFQVASSDSRVTKIACKQSSGWQLEAQFSEEGDLITGDYQTASSRQQLEAVIDGMISGNALDRNQEQQAINHQWQFENQQRGDL